jgi:acetyl-CoA acetyltransferase
MGRVFGRSAQSLAAEAVRRAVADAGCTLADVDGLLVNGGMGSRHQVRLQLARDLALGDLRLLSEVQGYGSSACSMVALAAMAIRAGTASTVVCVFADAPLTASSSSGEAYRTKRAVPQGWMGLRVASGIAGTNPLYALATRRHMLTYGTTSEQLGAIAVAQRQWAAGNPLAKFREPITLGDHQGSRMIADPLRLLDCCLVSNGAVAVVVTSSERAADLAQPPAHVLGWAQSHPAYPMHRDSQFGLLSGAAESGPAAMKMAGITVDDVDIAQLYDCYTFTVLLTLEDYGFCAKGEGGPFAASGALGPGGSLAVNTGGGQLSSYYMWGMTPLSEAVIQARGQGGDRQAPRNDILLVSGNGGVLDHHATLVLGTQPSAGTR